MDIDNELSNADRCAIAAKFWSGFLINGRPATWADMRPDEQASAMREFLAKGTAADATRLAALERAVAALERRPTTEVILERVAQGIAKALPPEIDKRVAAAVAKAEQNTAMKINSLELEFACALRRGPPIDPERVAALEKRLQLLEEAVRKERGNA